MDKIIHRKIRLNCNQQKSFEMFTINNYVQTWLAEIADIEPHVGGKYELFWDKNNKTINSTLGCRITAIENSKLLCFEWKGPEQFAHFMNTVKPLTHVTVLFFPVYDHENTTELHLIHTGWRENENWDNARMWFEKVWIKALDELEKTVNR